MKSVNKFITGLITGIIVMSLLYFFFFSKRETKSFEYVKLTGDFNIDNVGTLKKGTILKIDEPMPEGFTRYILYINLRDSHKIEIYTTDDDKENLIIPYWLQPADI